MNSSFPDWLTPVAWVLLILAVASAVRTAYDIYGRGHRHTSAAVELVWIASALYLGPLALALYARHGRTRAASDTTEDAEHPGRTTPPAAVIALPGGAASAVAHLIGVPLVIASGLTIAGIDLWVMILVIGVVAMALLVGPALLAAVITVLASDVGMRGWMLLLHFNEFMPPATEATFWFLMQVGVLLGLVTGYPAVTWLARRKRTAVPA